MTNNKYVNAVNGFIKNVIFRLRFRSREINIPLSTTIVNPQNIQIGKGSVFGPHCYIKAGYDNRTYIEIGQKVKVKSGTRISTSSGKITIDDYCYFGQNVWIGGIGDVSIGANSIFAMNVVIISSNHDYINISVPYVNGPEIPKHINIGSNVWVGANSVVLPGAMIDDGVVVAAGSVVRGYVEKNSLVAGNPAKLIKYIIRNVI